MVTIQGVLSVNTKCPLLFKLYITSFRKLSIRMLTVWALKEWNKLFSLKKNLARSFFRCKQKPSLDCTKDNWLFPDQLVCCHTLSCINNTLEVSSACFCSALRAATFSLYLHSLHSLHKLHKSGNKFCKHEHFLNTNPNNHSYFRTAGWSIILCDYWSVVLKTNNMTWLLCLWVLRK